MTDLRSFFSELKRRNVYKVAAAYAVVGWLVIQISSTVLPTFHAPEWSAYGVIGRRDEALQILDELGEAAKNRYVPNPAFALVAIGLGDKEKALVWLEKA